MGTHNDTRGSVGRYAPFLTCFFHELLFFFNHIRRVYRKTGNPEIKCSYGEKVIVCNIDDDDASSILVGFFCSVYSEDYEKDDDIVVSGIGAENEIEVYHNYSFNSVVATFDDDGEKISFLEGELDKLFLEEDTKTELLNRLRNIRKMEDALHRDIWSKDRLIELLNSYYELWEFFICNDSFLDVKDADINVIEPFINRGIDYLKGTVSMNSPLFLHAWLRLYDKLNEFLRLNIDINKKAELKIGEKHKDEECLNSEEWVYHEIFLSKVYQLFRFYSVRINDGERELWHASIPAIEDVERRQKIKLRIETRPYSNYSSKQGIRELRLAEKIIYEIERFSGWSDYTVLVFGDINKMALKELVNYLKEEIKSRKQRVDRAELYPEKLNITIDAYTKRVEAGRQEENTDSDNDTDIMINWSMHDYSGQLSNQSDMDSLLGDGKIVFFLDNTDLYKDTITPVSDVAVLRQSVRFDDYYDDFQTIKDGDLDLSGKFAKMYEILSVFVQAGVLGYRVSVAREDFVRYLKNKLAGENSEDYKNLSIYVYISDLNAFEDLKCAREGIVRIENYSQKKIGILRFSALEQENMGDLSERKRLTFSMWQFVKHVVLNKEKIFEDYYGYGHRLQDIHFVIDYTNWKKELTIGFHVNDVGKCGISREMRDDLKCFISFLSASIFSGSKDMYQSYLKRSFISFLYGGTKSVEDLLMLFLMDYREELLGNLRMMSDEEMDNIVPEDYENTGCKYSYKRIYWDIFKQVDGVGLNYLNKYVINKSVTDDLDYIGIKSSVDERRRRMYQFIHSACEALGYADTALNRSMIKMAEDIGSAKE